MPTVRRLRVSNPHKKRKRNKSARRTRRNPGEIFIVANPKRRRRTKKSYAKKNRSRNPRASKRFSFRRRHSRRSNPGIAGFNTNELIKLALGATAGVIGSKFVTQTVLGSNNAGPAGYAGQAVATLAIGWLANKFAGKEAATGVVAGGLGALALRIFQEQVSMTSSSMNGLGDPDMARLGVGSGMGEYRPGSIPMPGSFLAPPPVVIPTKTRSRG